MGIHNQNSGHGNLLNGGCRIINARRGFFSTIPAGKLSGIEQTKLFASSRQNALLFPVWLVL
jgi:hypothetical protein